MRHGGVLEVLFLTLGTPGLGQPQGWAHGLCAGSEAWGPGSGLYRVRPRRSNALVQTAFWRVKVDTSRTMVFHMSSLLALERLDGPKCVGFLVFQV